MKGPSKPASSNSVICEAFTQSGGCCRKIPAPGFRRCYKHGGLSTGPKSYAARLTAGERLKLYRVTGTARKGIPNGTKVKDRKARGERNRRLVVERRARKQERLRVKAQLDRVAAGLPAWTEAELDKLLDDGALTSAVRSRHPEDKH
jgi:hypothetical protein